MLTQGVKLNIDFAIPDLPADLAIQTVQRAIMAEQGDQLCFLGVCGSRSKLKLARHDAERVRGNAGMKRRVAFQFRHSRSIKARTAFTSSSIEGWSSCSDLPVNDEVDEIDFGFG